MKVHSRCTASMAGLNTRRDIGLTAICCLLLLSCASKTDRAPQITLLDFRTQNVERLHSGIEHLVGDDSAGVAAMEYVRIYEDDLVKYYPVKSNPIAPDEPPGIYDGFCRGYRENIATKSVELNSINPDPQTRRFLDYLKGRRMGAMIDLRKYHEEYLSTGSTSAVKMGIVNAYVATTAMPSPNEMKNIVDMVEPLLTELTKK
ncbi:MAG TPA: hypothetical protein VI932_10770 [Bacteroidota bacterium]|nr:hypothetical protein [Bacteroidota bacterium]